MTNAKQTDPAQAAGGVADTGGAGGDSVAVPVGLVRVELAERGYDIAIGPGVLTQAGDWARHRLKATHAFLITDANVAGLYAAPVAESLRQAGLRVDSLTLPAGETEKTPARVFECWEALVRAQADRKTLVVAVGGGVIGDLAGFVAATYTRGLRFLQIPTTLLAHVDSSVGGKVGVNLPDAKNMVGAFWQPSGVLIDTQTLDTLPSREYAAGLAEVVKYGVILDPSFFELLETNIDSLRARAPELLRRVIARCCQLKADVVRQDEREETGLRAVLNYGHTFCHAIETVTRYDRYLHGEAVSIGMVCASRLAERLGRVPAELTDRQRRLLAALDLPIILPPLHTADLIAAMQRDKKVEHGRLRFVLPTRLGHVELVGGIDDRLVADVLRTEGAT
ncbi:MAG: 3-dehydroquinate synthase [Planctomycetota bacterium]